MGVGKRLAVVDGIKYLRLGGTTALLAFRGRGFYSTGDNPDYFYFGGNMEMRGYPYLGFAGNQGFFANAEFRTPIIHLAATPLGILGPLRGTMFIGMAGMFLAPFGMVISKWAAIEAFITAPFGLIFITILAFGGSATVFFWSKWMGKIISVMRDQTVIEDTVKKEKWVVLYILTGLVVVVCLIFPLISSVLIEPFVLNIYGQTARLAQANLTIMIMMLCLLMIMPFSMLFYGKGTQLPATPYMGGRAMNDSMHFAGSIGTSREIVLSNYYLEKTFGEERLFMIGASMCWGLLLIAGILLLGVVL